MGGSGRYKGHENTLVKILRDKYGRGDPTYTTTDVHTAAAGPDVHREQLRLPELLGGLQGHSNHIEKVLKGIDQLLKQNMDLIKLIYVVVSGQDTLKTHLMFLKNT